MTVWHSVILEESKKLEPVGLPFGHLVEVPDGYWIRADGALVSWEKPIRVKTDWLA